MYTSPWPSLDIPACNILSYLFPPKTQASCTPIWIDADNTSISLSPAQMLSLVKRFAVGLDSLGIAEAEAIMIFSPNHVFVPLVYLAAAGSKRCFTGANPGYTASEVAHQIQAVKPAVLLIHDTLLEAGVAAAKQAKVPLDRLFVFGASEHTAVETTGLRDWRSILAPEIDAASWRWDPLDGEVAARTVAVINFSSGTTGLPKGVCITHHNLIANSMQAIFNQSQETENSPEKPAPERWLAFLPLYHAYSQLFTINIACKLSIPVYIMSKFTFEDFLRHIQTFKITTLQAVPPILVMMMKRPETARYDVRSIKQILCGAAPLSRDLQNDVMNHFGLVVCQAFGMSETTCAGIMTPGMKKDLTGSIGYLLPNTDAFLLGEDGKEVAGDGEPGELHLRGPQIMLGYWKNEQATRESMGCGGWLKTGDVAVTRQGKWWIVDRKKELIKVNVRHSLVPRDETDEPRVYKSPRPSWKRSCWSTNLWLMQLSWASPFTTKSAQELMLYYKQLSET